MTQTVKNILDFWIALKKLEKTKGLLMVFIEAVLQQFLDQW